MSDLIIAVYGSQSAAFAAGESLAALQRDAGVAAEDIAVVTRGAEGRVTVNQSIDLATGKPLGGGRWGALIGLLFLDGRAPTAAGRGLAAQLHAAGLERGFLHDVSHALDRGGAAVGMHVRLLGADRVRDRLRDGREDPRFLHTRLDARTEDALHDLQDLIPQAALAPSGGPT